MTLLHPQRVTHNDISACVPLSLHVCLVMIVLLCFTTIPTENTDDDGSQAPQKSSALFPQRRVVGRTLFFCFRSFSLSLPVKSTLDITHACSVSKYPNHPPKPSHPASSRCTYSRNNIKYVCIAGSPSQRGSIVVVVVVSSLDVVRALPSSSPFQFYFVICRCCCCCPASFNNQPASQPPLC